MLAIARAETPVVSHIRVDAPPMMRLDARATANHARHGTSPDSAAVAAALAGDAEDPIVSSEIALVAGRATAEACDSPEAAPVVN